MWKGIIDKYREFLPVTKNTPVITLNEGNTPLVYSCHLSELISGEVYLKYEGLNPTGSFKDRGMTMAISKSLEEKQIKIESSGLEYIAKEEVALSEKEREQAQRLFDALDENVIFIINPSRPLCLSCTR